MRNIDAHARLNNAAFAVRVSVSAIIIIPA